MDRTTRYKIRNNLNYILQHDATGGIIMIVLTIIALVYQNSPYAFNYRKILEIKAGFVFGDYSLIKPILLWINDGLISLFFFSIGLELKHEFIEGHLSKPKNIALPAMAALGGILMPSLIFFLCNIGDDFALKGWAIPTATDTAFSLAILLFLGNKVPSSLKIFLLSLAIFDDIGAIVIIAIFYTAKLSVIALCFAVLSIIGLLCLNLFGVNRKSLYFIFGTFLWLSILKSGVHATLAGIITAFFIPLKKHDGSPLVMEIYDSCKVWIAIIILPLFAFANAGIDLSGITVDKLFSGVPVGIFLGLFLGKQIGVFLMSYLCVKAGLSQMPEQATWKHIYGVCILTGVGFTMSMFVDGLAYWGSSIFAYADSFAIILASVFSGITGYIYLRYFADKQSYILQKVIIPKVMTLKEAGKKLRK